MCSKGSAIVGIATVCFLMLQASNVAIAQQAKGTDSQVKGGSLRFKIRVFHSDQVSDRPMLLIVLHGDAPNEQPDYHNLFAARAAASSRDLIAVGLLRPGYTDPQGHSSDGERGRANGDNWNAENTVAIAQAINALKQRFNARRVIVAGHSGGAAIAANILGQAPLLIGRALLVSCPCDSDSWRRHMLRRSGNCDLFQGRIDTLSPIEQIRNISADAKVLMVVGEKDEVTPPWLSERYQAAAIELGKNVELIRIEGRGHNIFLDSIILGELNKLLME